MSEDGFLSRWSRRKAEARDGVPTAETPAPVEPAPPPVPAAPQAADPAPAEPLPTLADVAQLTRDSDFTRFVAPGVDTDVRNAALKKLFSDPQFNVMDGLDTYIDDYNKPDPLPLSMLRKMAQAQFLGLSPERPQETAAPFPPPEGVKETWGGPAFPCESPEPAPHENPDLRLQSDDAAGRAGPEPGADGDAGREP
jgi:hypothetical protein